VDEKGWIHAGSSKRDSKNACIKAVAIKSIEHRRLVRAIEN